MKLKTFKGVGKEGKVPSKKDEGFLSIEKMRITEGNEVSPHFLVYRNYLGNTHFSSIVVSKIAKIKDVND